MNPDDQKQDNGGYADLSSLADEVGSEPDVTIEPDQAISDDGQIVELGEDGNNSVTKDI